MKKSLLRCMSYSRRDLFVSFVLLAAALQDRLLLSGGNGKAFFVYLVFKAACCKIT